MAEAYKNKLRIRIENLVGPKRKVDVTSCTFMKDVARELQQEFKSNLQQLFRKRAMEQAYRDQLRQEEEEKQTTKKPFFREDSDDEWTPYYSEESNEDTSSEELSEGDQSLGEQEMKETFKDIRLSEEQMDEVYFSADRCRTEQWETSETDDARQPVHLEELQDEEDKEVREYHEMFSEDDELSESPEDEEIMEEEVEEPEPEETSIFSHEQVFQPYRCPVLEQMEHEESIETLFSLAQMAITEEGEVTIKEEEDEQDNVEELEQKDEEAGKSGFFSKISLFKKDKSKTVKEPDVKTDDETQKEHELEEKVETIAVADEKEETRESLEVSEGDNEIVEDEDSAEKPSEHEAEEQNPESDYESTLEKPTEHEAEEQNPESDNESTLENSAQQKDVEKEEPDQENEKVSDDEVLAEVQNRENEAEVKAEAEETN